MDRSRKSAKPVERLDLSGTCCFRGQLNRYHPANWEGHRTKLI